MLFGVTHGSPAAGGGTATKVLPLILGRIALLSLLDDWPTDSLNSSQQQVYAFHVPPDFVSLSKVEIVMIPDTTETIAADVDTSVAAPGEDYNADTRQSLNLTLAVTINDLTLWDLHAADAALFASIAVGDSVAVRFQSNTSNLRPLGVLVTYIGTT